MLKCVSLNRKYLNCFKRLNDNGKHFNSLNEDFFRIYDDLNFIQKIFFRKRITLLKRDNEIIGFLWVSKCGSNEYNISSMFIDNQADIAEKYKFLLNTIRSNTALKYICERNKYNYELLKSVGFDQLEGTYEMHLKLNNAPSYSNMSEITFESLKKYSQEGLRCKIQNDVFKNETRIPLTIDDIYYDEEQSYYYEKGAVFIKKDNEYVGYGQIIINESIPTIVNIGILKPHRGKGYGEALMIHLLKLIYDNGFREVKLRVSAENSIALNMYKKLGFNIVKETHKWEYKNRSME